MAAAFIIQMQNFTTQMQNFTTQMPSIIDEHSITARIVVILWKAVLICFFLGIIIHICGNIERIIKTHEELCRQKREHQEELGSGNRGDLAQDQPLTITTVECGPKNALKINNGSTIVVSCSREQKREEQRKTIDQQIKENEEFNGANVKMGGENVEMLKEQKKAAWKMINSPSITSESTSNQTIKCNICFENERAIVFEPCMHLVACENCSEKLKGQNAECPLCRGPIQKRTHIFLA